MSKRTAKDEYHYDEMLRREEDVKTEVIVELTQDRETLLEDRFRLLTNLVMTTDVLIKTLEIVQQSRQAVLASDEALLDRRRNSRCGMGCTRHRWDDVDGWHRTDEEE